MDSGIPLNCIRYEYPQNFRLGDFTVIKNINKYIDVNYSNYINMYNNLSQHIEDMEALFAHLRFIDFFNSSSDLNCVSYINSTRILDCMYFVNSVGYDEYICRINYINHINPENYINLINNRVNYNNYFTFYTFLLLYFFFVPLYFYISYTFYNFYIFLFLKNGLFGTAFKHIFGVF